MSRRRVRVVYDKPQTMYVYSRPGLGAILLHTTLTVITGGFWLVILAVRYLLR